MRPGIIALIATLTSSLRLWPTQRLWAQELQRFSQEHARLKTHEKAKAQAYASPVLQGQFVPHSDHNNVFTGVSVPVHASMTWFSGSLFPPTTNIKSKE